MRFPKDRKTRKFICPVHIEQFRMLNANVTLALCPICYKMMIPVGAEDNQNNKNWKGLDKWSK